LTSELYLHRILICHHNNSRTGAPVTTITLLTYLLTYVPPPTLSETTYQTFSHTAKLSQHHSSTVTSRRRGRGQTNITYMMTALCQIEHRHTHCTVNHSLFT